MALPETTVRLEAMPCRVGAGHVNIAPHGMNSRGNRFTAVLGTVGTLDVLRVLPAVAAGLAHRDVGPTRTAHTPRVGIIEFTVFGKPTGLFPAAQPTPGGY
jgi:hypothetical protein